LADGGLMSPAAIDGSMTDAELDRLALVIDALQPLAMDETTAAELRHTLADARMRRDEELLIRIERSLLRIERGQSLTLNLLQRLVNAARPAAPSKPQRDERSRRNRDKSEDRK